MGDNANSFVNFISEDPIMLGLCIAIIVLIILFIIVLIVGKKREPKAEKVTENTTELLKTEVNLEALKSTQEYNVNELQNNVEEPVDTFVLETPEATEVPVTTEEPVPLDIPVEPEKTEDKVEVTPETIETKEETIAPVINTDEEMLELTEKEEEQIEEITPKIEESTMPSFEDIKIKPENIIDEPALEIEDTSTLDEAPMEVAIGPAEIEEPEIVQEPLDESTVAPIVESEIVPIEEETTGPTFEDYNIKSETPTIELTEVIEEPVNTIEPETQEVVELPPAPEPMTIEKPNPEPFSSVYLSANDEMPEIKVKEFDKTAIIRHIPVMEEMPSSFKKEEPEIELPKSVETEEDEIVLPKLNTSNDNSLLNALQGESFNIQ